MKWSLILISFHNVKYADHSHTKRCNFASELTGNNLLSCVIRNFPNTRASAVLRQESFNWKFKTTLFIHLKTIVHNDSQLRQYKINKGRKIHTSTKVWCFRNICCDIAGWVKWGVILLLLIVLRLSWNNTINPGGRHLHACWLFCWSTLISIHFIQLPYIDTARITNCKLRWSNQRGSHLCWTVQKRKDRLGFYFRVS